MSKGVDKVCPVCGNSFYVYPSRLMTKIYCSKSCDVASRSTLETRDITCERCGDKFKAKQDHGVWPKFCGRECFLEGAIKPIEKECKSCGSVFVAGKSAYTESGTRDYCSVKCKNDGQRKANDIVCECCGILFVMSDSRYSGRRFCSRKCSAKTMKKERATSWNGGKYKCESTNTTRVLMVSKEGDNREFYLGEHRIVAAKAIGRPLKSEENVLHLNRNNNDNRKENLFICASVSEMRRRWTGRLAWPEVSNLHGYGG